MEATVLQMHSTSFCSIMYDEGILIVLTRFQRHIIWQRTIKISIQFYFHFYVKIHDQVSQAGQRLIILPIVDLPGEK